MKMQWELEVTDTFGGDANYSWVERQTLPGRTTRRGVVRRLKSMLGITGSYARVFDHGDMLEVRPARDICQVGFATLTPRQ